MYKRLKVVDETVGRLTSRSALKNTEHHQNTKNPPSASRIDTKAPGAFTTQAASVLLGRFAPPVTVLVSPFLNPVLVAVGSLAVPVASVNSSGEARQVPEKFLKWISLSLLYRNVGLESSSVTSSMSGQEEFVMRSPEKVISMVLPEISVLSVALPDELEKLTVYSQDCVSFLYAVSTRIRECGSPLWRPLGSVVIKTYQIQLYQSIPLS